MKLRGKITLGTITKTFRAVRRHELRIQLKDGRDVASPKEFFELVPPEYRSYILPRGLARVALPALATLTTIFKIVKNAEAKIFDKDGDEVEGGNQLAKILNYEAWTKNDALLKNPIKASGEKFTSDAKKEFIAVAKKKKHYKMVEMYPFIGRLCQFRNGVEMAWVTKVLDSFKEGIYLSVEGKREYRHCRPLMGQWSRDGFRVPRGFVVNTDKIENKLRSSLVDWSRVKQYQIIALQAGYRYSWER